MSQIVFANRCLRLTHNDLNSKSMPRKDMDILILYLLTNFILDNRYKKFYH